MKTIIYQSFRTENVPGWIAACMTSVREWAAAKGFSYKFWDDRFFDLVPRELYPRASVNKCVLTDYARLIAAKQLLAEGWDRAVWMDADVVVFDADNFNLDLTQGYAFCREVWLDRTTLNRPQFRLTVNNSVSVFCRGETIIDFYLEIAGTILRSDQPLTLLSIGTDVLLKLRRAIDFPLLTTVGIFGPEMTYRYLQNEGRFLAPYLAYQTSKVYAANLCLSHQQKSFRFSGANGPWVLNNETVLTLLSRLASDHGASLNQWFDKSYHPRSDEFERPLSQYLAIKERLKSLVRTVQNR